MTISAPRWDLTNVYPSLESREFKNAVKEYKDFLGKLERFNKSKISKTNEARKSSCLAPEYWM